MKRLIKSTISRVLPLVVTVRGLVNSKTCDFDDDTTRNHHCEVVTELRRFEAATNGS